MEGPIKAHLICGGLYHDFDYARLQLLNLLAEHPRVRTSVGSDYREAGSLDPSTRLITYTCDLHPTTEEQDQIRAWTSAGGRWFALHGTNSAFVRTTEGVAASRDIPGLVEVLGSQFLAHPPIEPYRVEVTNPSHPLVAGIDAFETTDELYLSEYSGEIETLLHAHYSGEAPGFAASRWVGDSAHSVMYLREFGAGRILYLTLGHCRGHYDMIPRIEYWPTVDRGSWELDVFRQLLRRGLDWILEESEA